MRNMTPMTCEGSIMTWMLEVLYNGWPQK